MTGTPNVATYAGTAAAHEIVHRGAGPIFDLWGSYNKATDKPNLMNVDQAGNAGVDTTSDWSNPNVAAGFASLNSDQIKKLFQKCKKHHGGGIPMKEPTPQGPGGGGGGYPVVCGYIFENGDRFGCVTLFLPY
jgi:hypothetical protein